MNILIKVSVYNGHFLMMQRWLIDELMGNVAAVDGIIGNNLLFNDQ